jgi:GAF domain-containing protein
MGSNEVTEPIRQALSSLGHSADPGLARQLSELARTMQAEPDAGALLERIVAAAIAEIPGAAHAGITFVTRGVISTPTQSSALVSRIDQLQEATGQGPCLSASNEHLTVRADDLRDEPRWPAFAHQAAELGVLSMLSIQLFVEGDSFGSLNLYAETADAFDEDAESIGLLLASHAAIAIAGARAEANLRIALTGRDIIGQAKGILMERYKLDGAQAFDLLVRASQHTGHKLRDIADHLAATGEVLHSAPPS